MNVEVGQVLTHIAAFLIMLFVMKRYAWKPLISILDERRKKIEGEFKQADSLKIEASKIADEYRKKLILLEKERVEVLHKAENEAKNLVEKIQDDARRAAKEELIRVSHEMKMEVEKAKGELKKQVVHLTMLTTEKLFQKEQNRADQKNYIEAIVDEARLK